MAKSRGRPPKPGDIVKNRRVEFRVTASELDEINEAAEAAGMERSEWIRERLTAAARAAPKC